MSQISKAIATRTPDRNLSAAAEEARMLSASDLLPREYQGKPQNVLVAAERGRALGIDPMTAIQMVHVINGRPTMSAQLVNALVRRAGHTLRIKADGNAATCTIIRRDDPQHPFEVTWTMEMAKAAGITKNPTWGSYPRAMLKARAITECARDACPEVLAGISYTSEEVGGPVEITAEQTTMPELAITDDGQAIDAELVETADPSDPDDPWAKADGADQGAEGGGEG